MGEWSLILVAVGLFTLTETYQSYITLGLGLLTIFFAERGVRGRLIGRQSGLELPLLLFIVSAAAATWISYNPGIAMLQFARILGAAAIFFALKDSSSPISELVGFGFLAAAAWLAIYWPLQNDFSQVQSRLEPITELGKWINSWISSPPGPDIHKNVAAGTLLVSLPIGIGLSWTFWKASKRILGAIGLTLSAIVLFGLVMTSSLGALMGLLGTSLIVILVLIQRRFFRDSRSKVLFYLGATIVGLFGLIAVLGSGNLDTLVGQIPDPMGSFLSRRILWEEGAFLARDTIFTGSGLQSFFMVHAVYQMLIHVPYIAHAHNTLLEVWIEQGVVGEVALIWGTIVILIWTWKGFDRSDIPALGWGGLAAFSAASIHGMVDVPFYIERTLPVMGLVLGYCSLASTNSRVRGREDRVTRKLSIAFVVAILILGVIGLASWKRAAAAWFANLGAIEQARKEMPLYDPNRYQEFSLDQIRQEVDLNRAERYFLKALQFQPDNPTALQRLSMIALSRGEYQQALGWMDQLWTSGNREAVTRLLYGDALVANDEGERAAEVISGLNWAKDRLLLDAWLRYWNHQDYIRAASAWQTVLLLDPSDATANENLTKAQSLLNH